MGYEQFPHSIRFLTFELADEIQTYCDKHGLTQAEFGRLAVSSLLGVSAKEPKKITDPKYDHFADRWKQLYEQGWRISKIARAYGVSHQTVKRHVESG